MALLRRIAILGLCAVLLALSWWRSPLPPANPDAGVLFTPITLSSPIKLRPGLHGAGLTLEQAWVLDSKNAHFGGYSALASLGGGDFLALSDMGRYMRFSDPSRGDPRARMGRFLNTREQDKRRVDAESMTRDPDTGQLWVGYEQSNALVRTDEAGKGSDSVRPAAMRNWASNSGPEALVRLKDGRFIVIAEERDGWLADTGPALLFPSDPVERGSKPPTQFRYDAPKGTRATDMAQLPDGRVLILHREVVLGVPSRFSSSIAVADPAAIRKGEVWQGEVIATLESPLPSDNFEGMAIVPQRDGSAVVWIISDDNGVSFQRTLLLKLRWTASDKVPPKKQDKFTSGKQAREKGAR